MKTKFRIGDKVRIVNYGHLVLIQTRASIDVGQENLGYQGIIVKAEQIQGIDSYSLHGPMSKKSWYYNDQLELIYRPDYYCRCNFVMLMRDEKTQVAYCATCQKEVLEIE